MKQNHSVVIGFISPGVVDTQFAMSLVGLVAQRARIHDTPKVGNIVDISQLEGGGMLSHSRNRITQGFVESNHDWLLMLDTDQTFSVESFDKLCAAAHDKERPIVAGMYYCAWLSQPYPVPLPQIYRTTDHPALVEPILDYPEDSVIPIDSAGLGCLLVHRSVFEGIRKNCVNNGWEHNLDWCWFNDRPVQDKWMSDDHSFSEQVRAAGFQMYAHTGAISAHRKNYWVDNRHFRGMKELVQAVGDKEALKAVGWNAND